MKFNIRKNNAYLNVEVEMAGTKIDMGLHDDKEREDLAATLREAAQEIAVTDPIEAMGKEHSTLLAERQALGEALELLIIEVVQSGNDTKQFGWGAAMEKARAALAKGAQ